MDHKRRKLSWKNRYHQSWFFWAESHFLTCAFLVCLCVIPSWNLPVHGCSLGKQGFANSQSPWEKEVQGKTENSRASQVYEMFFCLDDSGQIICSLVLLHTQMPSLNTFTWFKHQVCMLVVTWPGINDSDCVQILTRPQLFVIVPSVGADPSNRNMWLNQRDQRDVWFEKSEVFWTSISWQVYWRPTCLWLPLTLNCNSFGACSPPPPTHPISCAATAQMLLWCH